MTRLGKKISRWGGLAFGWGLTRNIEEAYTFLMNTWRPSDRVFLFGFSRGAYTVRVLASMLRQVGLLEAGQIQLLPYALRLFNSIRGHGESPRSGRGKKYFRLCGEFRNAFAQPIPGKHTRFFPVHFMGVWDTVSAYGWIWNPRPFPYTQSNPSVASVRHAVSLDERRWLFPQNLFRQAKLDPVTEGGPRQDQDLVERWFPGVHADVGGGYPEASGGLWRCSFEWMVAEATSAGLAFDPVRLERVRNLTKAPAEAWREPKNESLTWKWRPAQLLPKFIFDPATGGSRLRIGLGYRRRTSARVSILRCSAASAVINRIGRPICHRMSFVRSWRRRTTRP
jgi:uncharacterized protein (DUF2235 family)